VSGPSRTERYDVADSPIDRTIEELMRFSPEYVVPCHCTGRKAIMAFEQTMPEHFIPNQSGTRLTFRS